MLSLDACLTLVYLSEELYDCIWFIYYIWFNSCWEVFSNITNSPQFDYMTLYSSCLAAPHAKSL